MCFIARLPIGAFHGISTVIEEKMQEMGTQPGADLQETSEKRLRHGSGKCDDHFDAMLASKGSRWARMTAASSRSISA